MENSFGKQHLTALCHIGYMLLYVLFLLPFYVWKKANVYLANSRQNRTLEYEDIHSNWPYLSFIKRLTFDFFFDFIVFIAPSIAFIFGIYMLCEGADFLDFLIFLLVSYLCLPLLALLKDLAQLVIVAPLRKYISWIKKPAQHMDLTMDKE